MPAPPAWGPWPKYPIVYEINTRVWLAELGAPGEEHPLTLDAVPEAALAALAALGCDAVWLMGVWTTGARPVALARTLPELQAEYARALPDVTAADVLGSPYAVTRYEVAPRLGGPAALARFRERLGRHGVRLLLDFVCNHTARDHALVWERPEVFVQGTEEDLARGPGAFFRVPTRAGAIVAHGRDPYFPPWTDTAQVNYARAPGRQAMRAELLAIAGQCDGVRCDMAMLLLPEVQERTWGERLRAETRESFWPSAIEKTLAAHPRFLFLAESYWGLEPELLRQGFHFAYDKALYDRLLHGDCHGVRQALQAPLPQQDRCARFLENHDEARAAAAFGRRAPGAASIAYCAPGLKLFHEGQFEGRRVKVPVQLGRRPAEAPDEDTAAFYGRLRAALRDPALRHGRYFCPEVRDAGDGRHGCLCALGWLAPGVVAGAGPARGFLAVANLEDRRARGRIPLPPTHFAPGESYLFADHCDGARYQRPGAELLSPGLYVELDAYQAHLFEIGKI